MFAAFIGVINDDDNDDNTPVVINIALWLQYTNKLTYLLTYLLPTYDAE